MAGQLGNRSGGRAGRTPTIGKLRHRVTIQRPGSTLNEFRERVQSWSDVKVGVWAEVMPVSGRELFQNGTVQAQATHRVRMRYRTDLDPKCRLVWLDTGLVLNIVACPPSVGASNLIEVMCVQEGGAVAG